MRIKKLIKKQDKTHSPELKNNIGLPNISEMYRNFASLEEKLKSIWIYSSELIAYSEEKHKKIFNKLWENSIPKTTSLLFKSHYLKTKKPINNILTITYSDLLHECSEIHEWSEFSLNKTSIKSHQLVPTSENDEFISKFLTTENLEKSSFKNYVVPLFFTLLLHVNRLHQILETPTGIPIDPLTRKSRALIAGEASAVGEDILRLMISSFLESKKDASYLSKKDFFYKESENIELILKDYQKNKIHTRHPKLQKKITYGQTLTTYSLPRKFTEWGRIDLNFEKTFLSKIKPKKKTSEAD